MIDAKLVRSKLEACHVYFRRVEPRARMSYREFSADYVSFNAPELRYRNFVWNENRDVPRAILRVHPLPNRREPMNKSPRQNACHSQPVGRQRACFRTGDCFASSETSEGLLLFLYNTI